MAVAINRTGKQTSRAETGGAIIIIIIITTTGSFVVPFVMGAQRTTRIRTRGEYVCVCLELFVLDLAWYRILILIMGRQGVYSGA
jgi:hypothetical protein